MGIRTKASTVAIRLIVSQNMPAATTIWLVKKWNGSASLSGSNIWSDGTNIYLSNGDNRNYVLNKETNTWEEKIWEGINAPSFFGHFIWSDGTTCYHGNGGSTKLNKETGAWESHTWNINLGNAIPWTDGTNIYNSSTHVLNKEAGLWEEKTWHGLDALTRGIANDAVWSDGTNIYYSSGNEQYVLNRETDTWTPKTWHGVLTQPSGYNIWSDGVNVYSPGSNSQSQYVLNGDAWEEVSWNGFTEISSDYVWTDGTHIYYSSASDEYVLVPSTASVYIMQEGAWVKMGKLT